MQRVDRGPQLLGRVPREVLGWLQALGDLDGRAAHALQLGPAHLDGHADGQHGLGHAVVQFARDAVPLVVQRLSLHRRYEPPLRLGQLSAAGGQVPGVPCGRVVELIAAATQLGSRVEQE